MLGPKDIFFLTMQMEQKGTGCKIPLATRSLSTEIIVYNEDSMHKGKIGSNSRTTNMIEVKSPKNLLNIPNTLVVKLDKETVDDEHDAETKT